MVQVASSILAADFANLETECRKVLSDENPMLHFDVMDGVFVPNLTVGVPVLASLAKAFPQAVFDVHLMIVEPSRFVQAFAAAGASNIIFHVEAQQQPEKTAQAIHVAGCRAGVSLRPSTPIEAVYPLLPALDQVLVMSVEPGFGGQEFSPEAPGRIRALRAEAARQGREIVIEVDGGINPETGALCAQAGADVLVAGSAVFHTPDPAAAVQALRAAGSGGAK